MKPPLVLKVGGSLAADPVVLRRVSESIGRLGTEVSLVIVPGGGPFADAVREVDGRYTLPATTAHWMAILGMDQFGHMLAALIPNSEVVTDQSGIVSALERGVIPVLAPSRWLSAADEVPHSWDVTSDSLAAYLATLIGAERLVLVKAVEREGDELVDPYFRRVLPAGIALRVTGPDGLASIGRWIRETDPA